MGSSGIINRTNKTQTINVPVQMQGAQIWGHTAGGGLAFNAPRYGSNELHLIGAQGGHFFFNGDGDGHRGDITLLTGIL